MSTLSFFNTQKDHSRIKAEIVSSYFATWASIILRVINRHGTGEPIGYVDLFAGTGRYEDGNPSTPLLVLGHAINNAEIGARLQCLFCDKELAHVQRLKEEIALLPGIDGLTYPPTIECRAVDEEVCRSFLEMPKIIPSLFFLDPCGYKGLTLNLIKVAIKDWACECIFFFNYNRINPALENECVDCHMDALFGEKRALELRNAIIGRTPEEREAIIMDGLIKSLREVHGELVLPFRFRNVTDSRTSHYLVFVTKDFLGYHKMKEIMAPYSSSFSQGVPSFEYNPEQPQGRLDFSAPLDDLLRDLPVAYSGRTVPVTAVYEQHSRGCRYINKITKMRCYS